MTPPWTVMAAPPFSHQFSCLLDAYRELKKTLPPEKLRAHPQVQLLRCIQKAVERLQENPELPEFRMGKNVLGSFGGRWRRVKKGMPPRYRLFFRFCSIKRVVLVVWVNDTSTLRKEGAKTDVYTTFKTWLQKGDVYDDWTSLYQKSVYLPAKGT